MKTLEGPCSNRLSRRMEHNWIEKLTSRVMFLVYRLVRSERRSRINFRKEPQREFEMV